MSKKYCEYAECMIKNHKHNHHDEHTITFTEIPAMNLLSLTHNMMDNKTYLGLSVAGGVFSCHVFSQHHPSPMVEISDDDLIRLRAFLNEVIRKK